MAANEGVASDNGQVVAKQEVTAKRGRGRPRKKPVAADDDDDDDDEKKKNSEIDYVKTRRKGTVHFRIVTEFVFFMELFLFVFFNLNFMNGDSCSLGRRRRR